MTTMIEDAVTQLRTSTTTRKTAQPRLHVDGDVVAVRYRTTVNGRELTTWRAARITSFVELDRTWLYCVTRVEGRRLVYTAVIQSDIRKL